MKNIFDLFKRDKAFYGQGFVYLDRNNNPASHMTDKVKWLDEICVKEKTEEHVKTKALNFLQQKYPQYKNMINIF